MPGSAFDVDIQAKLGDFSLDAQFSAPSGITVLTGASGAGKSSLVSALAGLLTPDSGRIMNGAKVLFDKKKRINLRPGKRRCGYVLQDALLFPHMGVKGNLTFGARKGQITLDQVVKLLGLGHVMKRRPHQLSGGERQRVAIGRALLSNPHFLLMDEPLTGLDSARRMNVIPFIEQMRDELGVPIVFVTHHWPEIVRLADTIAVMAEGKITACGPAADILVQLEGGEFGANSVGGIVTAKIEAHESNFGLTHLYAPAGSIYVPRMAGNVGDTVRVYIDARDVALSIDLPTGISIQNILLCRVRAVRSNPYGQYDIVLDLDGGGKLVSRITGKAVEDLNLKPGMTVHALIKSVALDKDLIAHPPS